MNKFIETRKNSWGIEELRNRILLTIGLVAAYRFGSFIVLPGIIGSQLPNKQSGEGLFGLVNAFTGGAFNHASILALGIMPYISASIIVQLLGFAVPYFQRLQRREGESGQRTLNQITRWLTIAVTLVQGAGYMTYVSQEYGKALSPDVDRYFFWFVGMFVLTAGTVFSMWLGERITERGLGNGTSLLIMAGIMSRLPDAVAGEIDSRLNGSGGGLVMFVLELAFLIVVLGTTILLVQGVRRIPVQYAKKMAARTDVNSIGGSMDSIPVKVNASGVMPIIFAQALMFLPTFIIPLITKEPSAFLSSFNKFTSPTYNVVYFLLIIVFTYVYTALLVNSQQYADFLKRQNGFIPGVQPGQPTADYIDTITSRITLPGSIGLGLLAILPAFVAAFGVNQGFALFFGGSSLIIMVGVVLDTLQQIESYLLLRRYDGLVQSGRISGRNLASFDSPPVQVL